MSSTRHSRDKYVTQHDINDAPIIAMVNEAHSSGEDELEDSEHDVPKPKKRGKKLAPMEQVAARRNFTISEFVTELTNYKNVPPQWKSVVQLVCPLTYRPGPL